MGPEVDVAVTPKKENGQDGDWSAVSQSVFKLGDKYMGGTAFKIGPNLYATDWHCLSGVTEPFVVDHEGKNHRAGADLWIDKAHDLAIFTLLPEDEIKDAPTLELGDSRAVRPGDPVAAYGFGLHDGGNNQAGVYSGNLERRTTHLDGNRDLDRILLGEKVADALYKKAQKVKAPGTYDDVLELNSANGHGTSGGPVVVGGKAIGLNDQGAMFGNKTLATPVEYLRELKLHPDKFEHCTGSFQNGFQAEYNYLRSHPLFAGSELGLYAAGFAGAKLLLKGATVADLSMSRRLGRGFATVPLTIGLMERNVLDFDALAGSPDNRSRLWHGLAMAADVIMDAGTVVSLAPGLGKVRGLGTTLIAAGLLGRMGAELAPSHFVVEAPSYFWST